MRTKAVCSLFLGILFFGAIGVTRSQDVEQSLLNADIDSLAMASEMSGNAARGAILFHGPLLSCNKCHQVGSEQLALGLGPNLANKDPKWSTQYLVDSVLRPSREIREEYRAVQILTADGLVIVGVRQNSPSREPGTAPEGNADPIVIRTGDLQDVVVDPSDIEQLKKSTTSIMPEGLIKNLTSQAQFFDLIKYLTVIRDGGAEAARELQPTAAQLAIQLPEYESDVDHRGFIEDWSQESFVRGEKIYQSLCINCHGTLEAAGSLATAPRFGQSKLKHGLDPFAMYQTLTRGAGLMMPQPWMVPEQKYDVIHYIRQHFLREHNASQLQAIDGGYLASIPKGSQRGPEPRVIEPWSQADYGPWLTNTYEFGKDGNNIAQKGIAIQLDDLPGGIAKGRAWAIFEHDTLRVAGVWTGEGFIDWQGIHFNGRHNIHPRIAGDVILSNTNSPGWAHPETGSLEDDSRVVGRDGKRYGPLPRDWGKYIGLSSDGGKVAVDYLVGQAKVRERYDWHTTATSDQLAGAVFEGNGLFIREMEIAPHDRPLQFVVADTERGMNWSIADGVAISRSTDSLADSSEANLVNEGKLESGNELAEWQGVQFDGERHLQVKDAAGVNLFDADFTIHATIRCDKGAGTIFARVPSESDVWARGGQAFFIRGGKLCYDIGWVGMLTANKSVDDGLVHAVAVTFEDATGIARLWIDGQSVAERKLRPKNALKKAFLRIGKASEDFPSPSVLTGTEIGRVQLFDRALTAEQLRKRNPSSQGGARLALRAAWDLAADNDSQSIPNVASEISGGMDATWSSQPTESQLIVGVVGGSGVLELQQVPGRLVANLAPSAERQLIRVWSGRVTSADKDELASVAAKLETELASNGSSVALERSTTSGQIFPGEITTPLVLGDPKNGFAVDELTIPKVNPWQARVRVTGLDFFEDPNQLAICTWDGDVWIASGLAEPASAAVATQLTWRRIASGLFQPLGLKIIDGTIYLNCRDQIMRLEDENGDGEIDYYRCVNSDHQVTEHFHEFAMGLQTDEQGNFYYAKSARHALPAVVPHHGTLLKVTPDGSRTEILATGFRAANGVCLNPDGSFVVTDQEGHWNPKNRINWVTEGGFYGNMYGYHDVVDTSDDAMEPPLCWITNRFDRSPAELLWVESEKWGPLDGQLLNLSYGYGRIYVVPFEKLADGQMQGGMCGLPIEDMPTGLVRGRFSPHDGQLYTVGMSAWASSQTEEEGGLYRVRYLGQPVALPVGLHVAGRSDATGAGEPISTVEVTFSEPLNPKTSLDAEQFEVRVWDLKRTKNYGSDHYNERELEIDSATLSTDLKTISLNIRELSPTWGMEIRLLVTTSDGQVVERVIHNTIHELASGAE